MSYRNTTNWLIILGTIFAVSLLSGISGLLMACRSSALLPTNFHTYGHCFVTDTPKEVFGSFATIGLILIGPLTAIFVVAQYEKNKRGGK